MWLSDNLICSRPVDFISSSGTLQPVIALIPTQCLAEVNCYVSAREQYMYTEESTAGWEHAVPVQEPDTWSSNPIICPSAACRGSMTFLSASCPAYAGWNGGDENGKKKTVTKNTQNKPCKAPGCSKALNIILSGRYLRLRG